MTLITTNPTRINVLVDAWTQRLQDLAPDLVDSPCWKYRPNCTKDYDGFCAWTDGGGVFEGTLNCNDAQAGSLGAWSNRMYDQASDHAKDNHEVGSDEYDDAIDEYQSDIYIRIKFQCYFYDHIASSNSSGSHSGREMVGPHFVFELFAAPDEYGRNINTIGDWEKLAIAVSDLTEGRMEEIAESQIKYFKEQMLGRES